jgi:uncharacterized membrane-anchored protein YitT (DUF2179 family)
VNILGHANKQKLIEYLYIVTGTTILAIAINVFFEPYNLVIGGVSGLSIIIKNYAQLKYNVVIPLWLANTILNLPIFIVGIKTLGLKMLKRTIFATLYLSFALYYTKFIPVGAIPEIDPILIALFGGTLSGAGIGLVFSSFSTTGGTDLAASIIHQYVRHIAVSKILFVLDTMIIILGIFMFGITKAMYAIIVVYVSSKVIDSILEGISFSKAALIISEHSETIAQTIFAEIDRGATGLSGRGMYTRKSKEILLCVVSKKEIIKLKYLVKGIDDKAFLLIFDIRETLGEGFGPNV